MRTNTTWRRHGWLVSGCAIVLLLTGPGCILWEMFLGSRGQSYGPRVIDVY